MQYAGSFWGVEGMKMGLGKEEIVREGSSAVLNINTCFFIKYIYVMQAQDPALPGLYAKCFEIRCSQ